MELTTKFAIWRNLPIISFQKVHFMTEIVLSDFRGFEKTISVDQNPTGAAIIEKISSEYPLDRTELYRFGQCVEPDTPLTDLDKNNRVAMINRRLIGEKSYPKVDHALRFLSAPFQEFFCEMRVDGHSSRSRDAFNEMKGPAADIFTRGMKNRARPNVEIQKVQPNQRDRDRSSDDDHDRVRSSVRRHFIEDLIARTGDLPLAHDILERLAREADEEAPEERPNVFQIMGQTFEFSPEEMEAINRLRRIAMDRDTVIQVFIACDRDESLAEGCLLSMQ